MPVAVYQPYVGIYGYSRFAHRPLFTYTLLSISSHAKCPTITPLHVPSMRRVTHRQ